MWASPWPPFLQVGNWGYYQANVGDPDPEPDPDPLVRGTDSDPHQNVMDPQHCVKQMWFELEDKVELWFFSA
jgi:hypothetical protein